MHGCDESWVVVLVAKVIYCVVIVAAMVIYFVVVIVVAMVICLVAMEMDSTHDSFTTYTLYTSCIKEELVNW